MSSARYCFVCDTGSKSGGDAFDTQRVKFHRRRASPVPAVRTAGPAA